MVDYQGQDDHSIDRQLAASLMMMMSARSPPSPPPRSQGIESQAAFRNLTRERSRYTLSKDTHGAYIIRKSQSRGASYSMDIRCQDMVFHYRLHGSDTSGWSIDGGYYIQFGSIGQLLEYYQDIENRPLTTNEQDYFCRPLHACTIVLDEQPVQVQERRLTSLAVDRLRPVRQLRHEVHAEHVDELFMSESAIRQLIRMGNWSRRDAVFALAIQNGNVENAHRELLVSTRDSGFFGSSPEPSSAADQPELVSAPDGSDDIYGPDNQFRTCKICYSADKDCRLIPCKHLLCSTCAQEIAKRSGLKCPFCRTDIRNTKPILIV